MSQNAKSQRTIPSNRPRDLVAKDLMTNGLYKHKVFKNRKREDRNKHKGDCGPLFL